MDQSSIQTDVNPQYGSQSHFSPDIGPGSATEVSKAALRRKQEKTDSRRRLGCLTSKKKGGSEVVRALSMSNFIRQLQGNHSSALLVVLSIAVCNSCVFSPLTSHRVSYAMAYSIWCCSAFHDSHGTGK